jgi:serine/threonine protein kinase
VSHAVAGLLRDEPGELRDVLGLFAESLRCLAHREQAGAAHEPVSPHTLQLSPSGRIEISAHGPAGERDTMMVSSPKYTAPELIRGRPVSTPEARRQADLYALGFVIYEFVLGRSKFRAEFPQLDDRGSELGWMEWHSDRARKAPPAGAVVPSTPAALSQLLEQLLDKDPAKRGTSYADVLKTVEELINRTRQTQQVRVPQAAAESKPAPQALRTSLIAVGFAAILMALVALVVRLLK